MVSKVLHKIMLKLWIQTLIATKFSAMEFLKKNAFYDL
jgi:hypothetical protein